MRNFIIKTFWFSCIFLALFAIIAGTLSLGNKYTYDYKNCYGLKERLLSETEHPCIIFQGGSNVTYGINSEAVEDSMHIHTINIALYVGLGMRLMLSEVLDCCREGDILVLSPEYEHFFGWAYGEDGALAKMVLVYPNVIKHYNVNQILCAAKGMPYAIRFMGNKIAQTIDDKMNHSNGSNGHNPLSFNSYGDEISHWAAPEHNYSIDGYELTGSFDEAFFDEFCETINNLKTRGIDVRIIPPSLYRKFYEEQKDKMQYVAERLREAGLPFEFEQELCLYEREDMFDSSYHLRKTGIDKRMKFIIDMLRTKSLQ